MCKSSYLFACLLTRLFTRLYRCIKRTVHNFHCDCDNLGDGMVNGTLSRRSAWHCVVIVAKQCRGRGGGTGTVQFTLESFRTLRKLYRDRPNVRR